MKFDLIYAGGERTNPKTMITIICAIVVLASFVAVLRAAVKGSHDYNSRRE